jgi:outer membrane protein OmpA-like peptidoglycan-associated protein
MKHIIRSTTGALVAGIIAAGCSTSPPQSDVNAANTAISNAEHAIDSAANDPHVNRYASSELGRAKDSLQQAQATWDKKHDLKATENLAYLAQQRAATAQELANERASEEAVTVAVAERDRGLKVASAARGRAAATITTVQGQQALAGFATGKATLPAGAMPMIDELATMLKNNPERKVVIEGHTDNVGSAAFNRALARERAQSVRAALLSRGIDPGRIVIRSSGEMNPVASNDTSAGRRANRRADVIVGKTQMARSSESSMGATSKGQSGQSGH